MLLIVMLESSSRSAPRKQAILMACSTIRLAWHSTIVEASCSWSTKKTIECKYSRVMMMMAARSCPSSAREATHQASSSIHWGLAIDHDHDRILIIDCFNHRVQSWSLSEQSFLSCIGHRGSRDLEFDHPQGIAIDKHHRRIIIVDTNNDRLVFLSSIDLSFLFKIGKQGSQPGEFIRPIGIAIDDDRHRIIVADTLNHRVQVLSLIDGSFLFEFGSEGNQPCQFYHPQGVCIDNQGRIIVADQNNYRLQSFTHEGHHISSFDCGFECPWGVAFDEHRGLIAFSAGHRVHVIGANQWLADTFTWRPDLHRYAPSWMKQAILTMTMIRSVVDECSAMSMIPNELLFEIFSHL